MRAIQLFSFFYFRSNSRGQDTFLYKGIHSVLPPNTELQSKAKIIIYGGLVACTPLFSLIRAILFFCVTVKSSKTLHRRMFDAVMRAPINFFDTRPVGRRVIWMTLLFTLSSQKLQKWHFSRTVLCCSLLVSHMSL